MAENLAQRSKSCMPPKPEDAQRAFNLMEWADNNNYQVRNLHDGYPVPPMKVGKRDGRPGYAAPEDRMDVIIGQKGYVCYEVPGRIGWYFCGADGKERLEAERKLRKLSATTVWRGDYEAGGDAPLSTIRAILRYIKAYRRRSNRPQRLIVPPSTITLNTEAIDEKPYHGECTNADSSTTGGANKNRIHHKVEVTNTDG